MFSSHSLHDIRVLLSRLCINYFVSIFVLISVFLVFDITLPNIPYPFHLFVHPSLRRRMSKPEEPMQMPSTQTRPIDPRKQWCKPTNEPKIGPQRRKRMPAGRHLDAIKTVPEQPTIPVKISEHLKAHTKDAEQMKAQPQPPQAQAAAQSKAKVPGEIHVK